MKFGFLGAAAIGAMCLVSCVDIDDRLGQDYLATDQKYEIYTAEFPLEDVEMQTPDNLSAYSLYRFTFGAVRDETFGLTTRSCAFTLVPAADSVDFGIPGTQEFKNFIFGGILDSVSCDAANQAHILQNVNVYELTEPLDYNSPDPEIKHGTKRISQGIPVYNGSSDLTFRFTKEFGEKYLTMTQADLDSISTYTKKFPGIAISTDAPYGNGGRINMFKLPIDIYKYSPNGSYAILQFRAKYEGRGMVDTSCVFIYGPMSIYDLTTAKETSATDYPQIALNKATHESRSLEGKAGENIIFEGGHGIKPVIRAKELRDMILSEVTKHGDISQITISKATLTLPFDFPDNYLDIRYFPEQISPTCRIVSSDGNITYAGITDSSVSTEDQGKINRSLCVYSPDITHHAHQIMNLSDDADLNNYDIWLLPLGTFETSSHNSSSNDSDYSDYLQQLAYANYYNNMYGGYGYGGYGGYGSYGYGGYNYTNYMMMLAMSQSSGTPTPETQTLTDLLRFYRANLHGPGSEGKVPTFSITYLVQQKN